MAIHLDAEAVRAEAHDRLLYDYGGDIEPADVEYIMGLDDDTINSAIRSAADDSFWTMFDAVRSDAMAALLRARDEEN